jgi:hypothetical protein
MSCISVLKRSNRWLICNEIERLYALPVDYSASNFPLRSDDPILSTYQQFRFGGRCWVKMGDAIFASVALTLALTLNNVLHESGAPLLYSSTR